MGFRFQDVDPAGKIQALRDAHVLVEIREHGSKMPLARSEGPLADGRFFATGWVDSPGKWEMWDVKIQSSKEYELKIRIDNPKPADVPIFATPTVSSRLKPLFF
jgi:hypothetical protein